MFGPVSGSVTPPSTWKGVICLCLARCSALLALGWRPDYRSHFSLRGAWFAGGGPKPDRLSIIGHTTARQTTAGPASRMVDPWPINRIPGCVSWMPLSGTRAKCNGRMVQDSSVACGTTDAGCEVKPKHRRRNSAGHGALEGQLSNGSSAADNDNSDAS